jgi:tetrahydromethanopterin S-methyltransferase subunit G
MDAMTPEKKWTDHRLDDLAKKVDDGVAQADKPLDDFRGEVNARFDKVDARFEKVEGKVDERFGRLDKKIDRLAYLLLTVALGYLATHAL